MLSKDHDEHTSNSHVTLFPHKRFAVAFFFRLVAQSDYFGRRIICRTLSFCLFVYFDGRFCLYTGVRYFNFKGLTIRKVMGERDGGSTNTFSCEGNNSPPPP